MAKPQKPPLQNSSYGASKFYRPHFKHSTGDYFVLFGSDGAILCVKCLIERVINAYKLILRFTANVNVNLSLRYAVCRVCIIIIQRQPLPPTVVFDVKRHYIILMVYLCVLYYYCVRLYQRYLNAMAYMNLRRRGDFKFCWWRGMGHCKILKRENAVLQPRLYI